jgi:hypothetical protein
MKCHDFEFEEFHIKRTVGLILEGFDFVVGILQGLVDIG